MHDLVAGLKYIKNHRCTHLLEFGGFKTPYTAMVPRNFDSVERLRITNVDPISTPGILAEGGEDVEKEEEEEEEEAEGLGGKHLGEQEGRDDGGGGGGGDWLRRNISMEFSQYIPDGDEDCFAFLGLDCRSIPEGLEDEAFAFLRGMKLIMLESAEPMGGGVVQHADCLAKLQTKITDEWGYTLIFDKNFYDDIKNHPKADTMYTTHGLKRDEAFRINRHMVVYSFGGKPPKRQGVEVPPRESEKAFKPLGCEVNPPRDCERLFRV